MKNHVKVVFCILAIALFVGIISWGADKLKKPENTGKTTPTVMATPTIGTPTPIYTPTLIPTATAAPKPTATTSPTKAPTEAPTEVPTEPLTPTPTPDPYHDAEGKLTADGAVKVLSGVSLDLLGLPKDIGTYKTEVDEWTSMVQATECYCINVITSEGYTAGIFYVAVDGTKLYSVDEEGNFNPIKIE